MTPQYIAARVAVRERSARQHYITCRTMYRAHQWSGADRRASALREAIAARTAWSTLHALLTQPERSEQMAHGIDADELATMAGAA